MIATSFSLPVVVFLSKYPSRIKRRESLNPQRNKKETSKSVTMTARGGGISHAGYNPHAQRQRGRNGANGQQLAEVVKPEIAEQAAKLAKGQQQEQLGADQPNEYPVGVNEIFTRHAEVKAQLKSKPERASKARGICSQQIRLTK